MNSVMKFFTSLGNFGAIWIFAAILLIISGSPWGCNFFASKFGINTKNYLPYGILLLIALLFSFLTSDALLKNLIQRPRPFINYPFDLIINPPSSYSMPSGHATTAFASAFILSKVNRYFKFSFVIAVIIAFSRLYLCVHYPSDVLIGTFIGIFCAWLVFFTASRIFPQKFLNMKNISGGI